MRSYFLVAIALLGGELVDGDFVGGEIVWWRDEGDGTTCHNRSLFLGPRQNGDFGFIEYFKTEFLDYRGTWEWHSGLSL